MSVKTTVSRVSSQSRLLSPNWCSLLAVIAVAPFATRQSIHALNALISFQHRENPAAACPGLRRGHRNGSSEGFDRGLKPASHLQ